MFRPLRCDILFSRLLTSVPHDSVAYAGGRQEFLMKGDCLTTMGNALEFAKVRTRHSLSFSCFL